MHKKISPSDETFNEIKSFCLKTIGDIRIMKTIKDMTNVSNNAMIMVSLLNKEEQNALAIEISPKAREEMRNIMRKDRYCGEYNNF